MYDISSRNSFNELDFHWNNFMKYASPEYIDDFPILLVGSKCDLNASRAVTMEEVLTWCSLQRPTAPLMYIEASSMLGMGVQDVFISIANAVVENVMLIEEYAEAKEDDGFEIIDKNEALGMGDDDYSDRESLSDGEQDSSSNYNEGFSDASEQKVSVGYRGVDPQRITKGMCIISIFAWKVVSW
jgi:GTPase SAR1 family protein